MVTLREEDRRRIAEAVAAAERQTEGEISCVLAREASRYREVPLAWAALAALILPPLGLALGLDPLVAAERLSGWAAGNASPARDIVLALSAYAVIQALLFSLVVLLVSIPVVRRAMTPSFLKRHRAGQSARQHFATLGARFGQGQAFVLIYASLADHRVEIVASEAIQHAGGWDEAAAALSQGLRAGDAGAGFVRAIGIVGAALARHFPAKGEKRNAMPDTLLEP